MPEYIIDNERERRLFRQWADTVSYDTDSLELGPDPDDPEDDYQTRAEGKAIIRHVRTPEGARRYNQPIGSVIVADSPVSAFPEAPPMPEMPDLSSPSSTAVFMEPLQWHRTSYGASRGSTGRYRAHVKPRFDARGDVSGVWDWEIGVPKPGWSGDDLDMLDYGEATSIDAAEKAAARAIKKRDAYFQDRPEREHMNLRDAYPGIYGLDYVFDANGKKVKVKAADVERYYEDDTNNLDGYRWTNLKNHMAQRGISREIGGSFSSAAHKRSEDELDVNALESMMALMESHEEMFPGWFGLFNKFVSDDMAKKPTVIAYNGYDTNTGQSYMGMNSNMFGNGDIGFDNIENSPSYNNLMQFSVNIHDIDSDNEDIWEKWQTRMFSTISHELGHTIARAMWGEDIYGLGNDAGWGFQRFFGDQQSRDEFMEGLWYLFEDWDVLIDPDISLEDFTRKVDLSQRDWKSASASFYRSSMTEALSLYGGSSMHEMIAEAWAEYVMEENPRGFATDVGNLVSSVFADWMRRRDAAH